MNTLSKIRYNAEYPTGGQYWLAIGSKGNQLYPSAIWITTALPSETYPSFNYMPTKKTFEELKHSSPIQAQLKRYEHIEENIIEDKVEYQYIEVENVFNLIELSNSLLSHSELLSGNLSDLLDQAKRASSTTYPTIKGMR